MLGLGLVMLLCVGAVVMLLSVVFSRNIGGLTVAVGALLTLSLCGILLSLPQQGPNATPEVLEQDDVMKVNNNTYFLNLHIV